MAIELHKYHDGETDDFSEAEEENLGNMLEIFSELRPETQAICEAVKHRYTSRSCETKDDIKLLCFALKSHTLCTSFDTCEPEKSIQVIESTANLLETVITSNDLSLSKGKAKVHSGFLNSFASSTAQEGRIRCSQLRQQCSFLSLIQGEAATQPELEI